MVFKQAHPVLICPPCCPGNLSPSTTTHFSLTPLLTFPITQEGDFLLHIIYSIKTKKISNYLVY